MADYTLTLAGRTRVWRRAATTVLVVIGLVVAGGALARAGQAAAVTHTVIMAVDNGTVTWSEGTVNGQLVPVDFGQPLTVTDPAVVVLTIQAEPEAWGACAIYVDGLLVVRWNAWSGAPATCVWSS